MSIAKLSNGTLLKRGDGASPEAFTTIPEVRRIGGPSATFEMLDISSHDSPTLFKEWLAGMSDGDMVDFESAWRPSNTVHINVRADNYNAVLRNFKIVFPDTPNNTVTFAAYVQHFSPNADVGKEMMARGRLKISGAPVWS